MPKVELVTWAIFQPLQFAPVAYIEATSFVVDQDTHVLTFFREGKVQSVWQNWCHFERQEAAH